VAGILICGWCDVSIDLVQALRRRFEEVLREALQHAARLVDRHLFGRIEAAGHRHFGSVRRCAVG
jgi:hypothetical protein